MEWYCSDFKGPWKSAECARRDGEPKEGVKDWYYLTHRGTQRPVISGDVPASFLTEKDLAAIGRLYSYKGDFYRVIGLDHLFVKHNLMKKQGPDHYKERATWLHGALNESKREMSPLIDERDKLKKDLEAAESDVAEFSKRCDLANQAQEITAKALA
ncbi:hypothetical protein Fot_43112 [Forsythia ovata]|uniref:Uncharacterized protein n=1 Tax=Forsythia ovata TaxID=205694 RepID=A0ABD1RN42_9LAMI